MKRCTCRLWRPRLLCEELSVSVALALVQSSLADAVDAAALQSLTNEHTACAGEILALPLFAFLGIAFRIKSENGLTQ